MTYSLQTWRTLPNRVSNIFCHFVTMTYISGSVTLSFFKQSLVFTLFINVAGALRCNTDFCDILVVE